MRAVYLDAQATTPMDPRVLDIMLPYLIGSHGNPHSRTHSYGWEASDAVEVARKVCWHEKGKGWSEVAYILCSK